MVRLPWFVSTTAQLKMEMINSFAVMMFALVVRTACQGVISLSIETLECGSGSAVLPCTASGVRSILFQVYEYNGIKFSTLDPGRLSIDPEYDEIEVDGVYKLRVVHVHDHNGSLYRCTGFFNGKIVYSNEVLLLQSRCTKTTSVSVRPTEAPSTPIIPSSSSTVPGMSQEVMSSTIPHSQASSSIPVELVTSCTVGVLLLVLSVMFALSVVCISRHRKCKENYEEMNSSQSRWDTANTVNSRVEVSPDIKDPTAGYKPRSPLPTENNEEMNLTQSIKETANAGNSSVQVLPDIKDPTAVYKPISSLPTDCTIPPPPPVSWNVNTAEYIADSLKTSEAVVDNVTSGALVCGSRLLEPHSIRQHFSRDCGSVSHYQSPMVEAVGPDSQSQMHLTHLPDRAKHETISALDLAGGVPMVPNPAYEDISALDLADACMTKNPSYVTIQPWQRESVAHYKARTTETNPTFRSRPLPDPPELEEKRKQRQFRHAIKPATMALPVQRAETNIVCGCGDDSFMKWTSIVKTSAEGIAHVEEEPCVAPALPIPSERDF